MITKETITIGNPENIKGLVFEDEVKAASVLVPQLKKTSRYCNRIGSQGILTIKNKKVTNFEWKEIPIILKNKVKNAEGKDELKFIDKEIKEDDTLLAQLKPYADQVLKKFFQK